MTVPKTLRIQHVNIKQWIYFKKTVMKDESA